MIDTVRLLNARRHIGRAVLTSACFIRRHHRRPDAAPIAHAHRRRGMHKVSGQYVPNQANRSSTIREPFRLGTVLPALHDSPGTHAAHCQAMNRTRTTPSGSTTFASSHCLPMQTPRAEHRIEPNVGECATNERPLLGAPSRRQVAYSRVRPPVLEHQAETRSAAVSFSAQTHR